MITYTYPTHNLNTTTRSFVHEIHILFLQILQYIIHVCLHMKYMLTFHTLQSFHPNIIGKAYQDTYVHGIISISALYES